MMMQNFIGKDGFYWWMGVIEDRDDPLGLGRCRVRIFGHHTENIQMLPTDHLPWALPLISPNSTMTNGTGLVGDYAFGFFSDGLASQAPLLIGIFPGIPQKDQNKSEGFFEGTHYPVGEPTTSRLFRNENIANTVIGAHNSNLDKGVATADGNTWDEPASEYAAVYPYNRVTQTESGHVFELDDTPGAERIHLSHKANTFMEIAPDGSKVTKVSGKNYEIYLSDNNVHIKGTCNITVEGDANLLINGNCTAQASVWDVTGDVNLTGNLNTTGKVTAKGNISSSADVIAGTISLTKHKHPDPQGGLTSPPV
jgi:Gp5 N-terminal OB domain